MNNDDDKLQLVCIDSSVLPQSADQVQVTVSGTEENTLSMNVRHPTTGSNVYKLDLSGLDSLKDAFARGNEIDLSSGGVSGLRVETMSLTDKVLFGTHLLAFADYLVQFNARELTFCLRPQHEVPFDRADAFLRKLDSLSRADKDDFVANYKADQIQWQVKESGWLAHPVRLAEDPRGDCSLDSFKDFFQSILDHYCSHY